MILLKKTKSICPKCFKEINALVYQENNKVYMKKECFKHGKWAVVLEKDARFYTRLMNHDIKKDGTSPARLVLPVSHECNLNCSICYLPYKNKELSSKVLKRMIDSFEGNLINLSGGEPTLRRDLPELIKYVHKKSKKFCVVATNGIKLSDERYVKRLKNAGLSMVSLPLNSLEDKIIQIIEGKKLLNYKLKAIENLKKNKIDIVLGTTILKGVNENELEKIFKYYLANSDFITQWRIRSGVQIGRYNTDRKYLYLSEIINKLCKIMNKMYKTRLSMDYIIKKFDKRKNPDSVTCKFTLFLLFSKHQKGMDLLDIEVNKEDTLMFCHSRSKRLSFGLRLIRKRRTISLIKHLKNKILFSSRVIVLPIEIRCWPTKYTIDLNEMSYCNSRNLGEDGKITPYCYSLVLNEKTCKQN